MTGPKKKAKRSLADIGKAAARRAQRDALLAELEAQEWNLTATAEVFGMAGPNVIRALKDLAPDEYEKARKHGRISPANRRE
jgi:hypothetical protein